MALGMKLQFFHDFIVSQKRLKYKKKPNHIIYRNMSRKPQSLVRFLSLSLPDCLMEFCNVTPTFESADKILWCDHSNESSLPLLSHGAICFSKFHKIKFGDLVKICFWLKLAVKGLIYQMWATLLTTVFIIVHVRDVALIQGDACEPFFFSFFFFCAICGAYSCK